MKKMKKTQTKPTIENKHMSNIPTSNIKSLNSNVAITLIALIITIIVLLILAGVSIAMLTGENGLLNKTQTASDETKKSQATETMNLKITNIQISSYAETQELPNLQYLADKLCEDNDMEYVLTASKEHASLDKIDVTNISSIFTKLKEYPYEFEINSSLQLASIDGVKIADNNNVGTVTLTQSQYNSILNRLSALENNSSSTTTNNDYSTEEQVVGTWIDGKKMYRKVFHVDTRAGVNSIDISSLNLEYGNIVNFYCTNINGKDISIGSYYIGTSDYVNYYIMSNKKSLIIRCGSQYSYGDTYLTLEYTKTTDNVTND